MAGLRLYLHSNYSSLYFQIKYKGQRYIIYFPDQVPDELEWRQEQQCFVLDEYWIKDKEEDYIDRDEDFFESEEYQDVEYEMQRLNVDINCA